MPRFGSNEVSIKTKRRNPITPISEYRSQAKKAAKDLRYGDDVIQAIKNAKSEAEIARIMKTARERSFDDDKD